MTVQQYLDRWNSTAAITPEQYELLSGLDRGDRFSVFAELNTLLYLGVVALVAGVGLTIRVYSASLGDVAILGTLTLASLGCIGYCFSRALPYTNLPVRAQGFAFDYVLYLGCLLFAAALGYVEVRFQLLQQHWDYYLLASAFLYFVLAYRFDNRLVLALGLSTLAGWFGLRLWQFHPMVEELRLAALVYGLTVAAAGIGLHRAGIKRHFIDAYLHVAVNVTFIALLSGIPSWSIEVFLIGLAAVTVVAGLRFKRFAFVVYGAVYGYIGVTSRLLKILELHSASEFSGYFVVTGIIMVSSLVALARRFGREE